jgi:hypothetical protein
MLRDGYPRLFPPHDWARRPTGALPEVEGRVVLGQWISEHGDSLTIHQHDPPERERKRFSVVWEPAGDGATRTIWGSSVATTRAHVRRTFERTRARNRD